MDQIRTIAEDVVFSALRPEFVFILPDDRKQYLKDVSLCLVTKAGEVLNGAGCDDIHLHVNDADITSHLIAEFKAVIQGRDQNSLKQQYAAAMDRWLKFASSLGAGYGTDVPTERARASQLAATSPISSLADKIGDARQGWSGHLHLLNFHDQFDTPFAASMGRVLARFNATSGANPITALTAKQMTISSGPSPTLGTGGSVSRGGLSIRIDLIYHDPLEDDIKELRDQFAALKAVIDTNLTMITQALSSGGPIQRHLNSVDQQIANTQQMVDQARRDIASQDAHLTALENTLTDIQRTVHNL